MVQLSTDSIRNYLKSRRICREGEIPLNPPFRKGEAAVWLGFEIVTKLTIVRRASIAPADGTFDLMEDGIQIIEDFIGVTWPNGDVLLLAEPELELAQDDPPLGFFSHSHMVIDLPERHENFPRVLYHELAHFYLNGGNMPILALREWLGIRQILRPGTNFSGDSRFPQEPSNGRDPQRLHTS